MAPPKLTSLARKQSDKADMEPEPGDEPRYPWGMGLYLDNPEIEKLRLQGAQVGDDVMMVVKGKVTSISEREEQDGDTDRTVNIQITDAAVDQPTPDKASRMFGGSDE